MANDAIQDQAPSVTFLNWTARIETDSGAEKVALTDIDELPTGTAFSLSGTVTAPGYLYAVILGEHSLAVLYPADGKLDQESSGAALDLPAPDSDFVAPIDGEVRVFLAPAPVAPEEWSKLFPGRDPWTKDAGGKDSVLIRIRIVPRRKLRSDGHEHAKG